MNSSNDLLESTHRIIRYVVQTKAIIQVIVNAIKNIIYSYCVTTDYTIAIANVNDIIVDNEKPLAYLSRGVIRLHNAQLYY
jgi:hypothetical protein